jgi:glycosyltransferase involved in cell wall biosynthesis
VNNDKILWINGKFLSAPVTGVQRFARGMCKALHEKGCQLKILVNRDHDREFEYGELVEIGKQKGVLWEQVELPRYLKRCGNPFLLNFCNVSPLIYSRNFIVIHDLAVFDHPEWFSKRFSFWYRWVIPKLVKKSQLATVSGFSKTALVNKFNLVSKDILVLPNGVYFDKSNFDENISVESPYILAVGSHSPRKGLGQLIKAFSKADLPNVNLYIVGSGSHHFSGIEKLNTERIKWVEVINDAKLCSLYRGCKVVVQPSFYEGFGLPILEGLFFKKQVLANDLAVFRELFGNSIKYTNTLDTEVFSKDLTDMYYSDNKNTIPFPEHLSFDKSASKLLQNLNN